MAIDIVVPAVGESVTEAEIGQWRVAVGGTIQKDAVLVDLETDKVTVELPAPESGTITGILAQPGETVEVGAVIARLEPGEVAVSSPVQAAQSPAPEPVAKPPAAPQVMPAAKRALAEHGLQAGAVQGSGRGGRITKEDVERAASQPAADVPLDRAEEVIPMTPMRRRIAERLVTAQQTAALLTTFNECNLAPVMALRKQHQEAFVAKYGIKLGFMSFFVKAVIDALKQFPALNAEVRDDSIVYHHTYDIGVAIGGGRGLVVPVLRNADRMGFAEVEQAIADYAAKAKSNTLKIDDLTGGTFTISNGGVYGSMLSTPIINPPQSGILGMHNIIDRPIAEDGQVVIRPMMYLALTYDHRIVDGREAVTFLRRIRECLETPTRMLLEI